MSKSLIFFVEGFFDRVFIEKIVLKILEDKTSFTFKVYEYSEVKSKWKKLNSFLSNLEKAGIEYLFLTDINNAPCISARKIILQEDIPKINPDKIVIVKKEIESWFLAGIDEITRKKIKIEQFSSTDTLSKEDFSKAIGSRKKVNVISEICRSFNLNEARRKNNSFDYFLRKLFKILELDENLYVY